LADKDEPLLRDILEHAHEAQRYLSEVSIASFRDDRRLRLAIERLLEIVGEAAGALSEGTRASIDYDWRAVRGLRDVLAHQYGSVDPDQLHRVVTNRLPDLVRKIEAALRAP
jgi:uncharacterized protein with HEPN domain